MKRRILDSLWCGRIAVLLLLLAPACSVRTPMPDEPENNIVTGEIAYVVQYRWEGLPRFGDLVLTRGQILYAVEDSTRVRAWFSDTATPRENQSRSLPIPIRVDTQEISGPVQIAEGPSNTLWVAFLEPSWILLQFDVSKSPPELTGNSIKDRSILSIGGITADPDSGFVYIADALANTITKYEPSQGGGSRVVVLSTQGNGDNYVREPMGIHFFSDSLLVADAGKTWLQVIDADVPLSGRGQIAGPETGIVRPVDVWVDASKRFYVADTGTAQVLQLTSLGELKEVVTQLDSEASLRPVSVVANRTQVWVPDPASGRLTVYQINTASEDLP